MSDSDPGSAGSPTPTPPPSSPNVPPSPTPPRRPRARRLGEWAAVASAVAGVAGVLLAVFGLPTLNSPTARGSAPASQPTVSVTPTAGAAPASSTPPTSPPPPAAPTPVTKSDIRMPTDFYFLFSEDPLRLHEMNGPRGDLIYTFSNDFRSNGHLVRLDADQPGSLEECRSDTRYTSIIRRPQLTKGTRICVLSRGHVGLVTVREAPQERDDGDFITIDLTVWP